MGSFALPSQYQYEPVPVTVVGAGGTGGEVMDGLARLHFALKALGHEYGLDVTLIDDDVVSESNIGRQRFSPVDRKSTRLNSSHYRTSRMPSSA